MVFNISEMSIKHFLKRMYILNTHQEYGSISEGVKVGI